MCSHVQIHNNGWGIGYSPWFTFHPGFGLMVLGPEIQIGIFGSLHISNPDITLNGTISVGTRGAVLELTMTGCWEQAFGADWLTICSRQGLIALKPELDFLPGGLALGGQVKIGKPSCRQIQATGFIGINAVMPQENYFKSINLQVSVHIICMIDTAMLSECYEGVLGILCICVIER